MAVISGTSGSDIYTGTVGIPDTALFVAGQIGTTFGWFGNKWVVVSADGVDQLISIETVQLADATFQLTGPGSFAFGQSSVNYLGQAGSVARLGDGSFIHTLSRFVTASREIVAQRISSTGELIGAETTVNTTLSGSQFGPDVAVLSTGEYVVTWSGPDFVSTGIYMQRYSAAGAALGGEVAVNTITAFSENNSQVTALTGGRYIVTWESFGGDASGFGVFGQIYSSAGTALGGEFRVNTTFVGEQLNANIAPLSDGGFVATYASDQDLKFQRYTSAGIATGPERTFGNVTEYGQASTTLSGDRVVVVTTESYLVKVVTLDASGTTALVEKRIISSLGQFAYYPAVAALSDGGYVVSWFGDNGAGQYDLHVQRLDSNGLLVGGDQTIVRDISAANNGIEIAADATGGYALQYVDGSLNVFSVRFDGDNLAVLPSITGDEASNIIRVDDGISGVRLNGLQGNDRLTGTSQADILDGGEGNDRLIGGAGDDTYIVTQADRIIEAVSGGRDTVVVRENYVLTARNVENIEIKGTAAVNVTGNPLDNTIIGNRADNKINGGRGLDTMIGGAGNDTYFVDERFDQVIERTNEGIDTVITTADSYTLAENVENARAAGDSNVRIDGNGLDNLLVGNNGNNYLDGNGGGADVMEGRGGDDFYVVTDTRTQVIERVGGGIDRVAASVSWVLDDNVEELQLFGGAPINGTGNDLNNILTGTGGANILDGGAGADTMFGDDGADIYIVDNTADVAAERIDYVGADEVRASVTYTIAYEIENLTLTGTANINGTGNSQANVIRGNSGANILDGGLNSGSVTDRIYGYGGDDTLIASQSGAELYGGTGNDTYRVYSNDDQITELANQGTDTVQVFAPLDFQLSENVENLILQSFSVFDSDTSATGNNLNNQITGNLGSNVIDGGGGADTMAGGGGDDTYFVDNTADVVVELTNDGEDTIMSAVSYTASANVENLILIGSTQISATGNALDNVLNGNSANNAMSGLDGSDILSGGNGNDTMVGGIGNDILIGGNGNDYIDGGADIDTVNYRRATGSITVNLTLLTAQTTGAGLDTILGIENVDGSNTGNDVLTGNGAANRLSGLGGSDSLFGGGGADVLLGGEGQDYLAGGAGDDRIDGGNGNDIVAFQFVAANITVDLSQLGAQNTGEGFDTIRNIETIYGSETGNDSLTGDYQSNGLYGLGGNDTIAGGDGADTLDGGAGTDTVSYAAALDDVVVSLLRSSATDDFGTQDTLIAFEAIIGGAFDDTLGGAASDNVIEGGLGRDVIRGNGGNDTFFYRAVSDSGLSSTSRDLILDWSALDKINLASIDANTVTAGDQAFTFIGTAAYSSVAGQLRQQTVSGQVLIEGDIDGNGISDFSIAIKGAFVFAAADFVL